MEGRKEPSILRCFFLLLSSLQVKTCPSRCWCRFFYRLKRTYFHFLRQSHLRKPFALHIADAVKEYSLPAQKDNLSGNFVYSPHLPDHGNAAFARLSSVWPEAYKVTSGAFLKMTIQHLQIPVQDGWVVFSQPGLCGRQPGCFIRLISSCVEGLKWM